MKSLFFAAFALAVASLPAFRAEVCRADDVAFSTTVSHPGDTSLTGAPFHRGHGGVHFRPHFRPYFAERPYYAYPSYVVTPGFVPYTFGPTYYPIYPSFVSPYDVGYRFPGARW